MSEPPDDFKPLRLSGGRFDEASVGTVGFPLEAIAELARYERLLIKVARELWRKENPHRTRAPKGFDEQLRLRLTTVTEGCVTPVLLRGQGDADRRFDPDGWMHRARSSIAEALSAIVGEQRLPSTFPAAARRTLAQGRPPRARGTRGCPPLPDLAVQGIGAGDVSILAEAEAYAQRVQHVDVRVWTREHALAAYA